MIVDHHIIYVALIHAQVLNLRTKGAMAGEGGGFNYKNLYYLSIHTLDSASGVSYAKTRVAREVLDAWLQKRVSFDGHKYEEEVVQLTAQELHFCLCYIN